MLAHATEDICHITYVGLVHSESLGHKRLEGDDGCAVLELKEEVGEVNVERGGEHLVVDKNHVSLRETLGDLWMAAKVALMHLGSEVALEAPHGPSPLAFTELQTCTSGWDGEQLKAVACAAGLHSSLDNAVAHTAAEINKRMIGTEVGLLNHFAHKVVPQLAVRVFLLADGQSHLFGVFGVVLQLVRKGRNDASVRLLVAKVHQGRPLSPRDAVIGARQPRSQRAIVLDIRQRSVQALDCLDETRAITPVGGQSTPQSIAYRLCRGMRSR